jgi:eukaryotic-like serine/threonine-protein kinase
MTLAAGALLLGLVAAGSWMLGARSSSQPLPTYHQLTFDRGQVYTARFAPDGRSIYYSASWNGEPVQLYSSLPDAPESRPLNLGNSTLFAVSASQLAISAGCKDRYIGLCQGTLGLVPLAGGTPRQVADGVLAADWSADGSEMALILQVEGKYRVEFPRGKSLYESTHPLGYLRVPNIGTQDREFYFFCFNLRPAISNFPPSTILMASVYATCSCSRMRAARVCSSSLSRTGTAFCTMIAP